MAPMFADAARSLVIFGSSRKGSVGDKPDPRTGESYMDLWMSAKDKKGNKKKNQNQKNHKPDDEDEEEENEESRRDKKIKLIINE